MHMFKKTISILMTLATLDGATAQPAHADKLVVIKQRPDLQKYCQTHHRADARLTAFQATAWQCYKSPSQTWGISVSRACKDQFGLPKAKYEAKNDPYSWYCYRPAPPAPGVDLTRYCKKRFGQSAYAKLVGGTALDWVCTAGQHDRWGISVSQACREQHGLPKASYKARSNPYSWFCHR